MVHHSVSLESIAEAICERDEVWLRGHDLKDYFDL